MSDTTPTTPLEKDRQETVAATKMETQPSGKVQSPFFAAVRERGVLNAILDDAVRIYEEQHPGFRCRWEFYPASGDNMMIVQREALGFVIVDASEIKGTNSSQKSGPIRRGDVVLMAAPEEIVRELERADAAAAATDAKLPERVYREALERHKARDSAGNEQIARPVGQIKESVEYFHKSEEGGE